MTPSFPAKVVPIDLSNYHEVVMKPGAYLSSIGDVAITADFDCCTFASCCGGVGAIRENAKGSGTLFAEAGGTIMTKVLADGETIVVDNHSIVGFQKTAKLGLKLTGGAYSHII